MKNISGILLASCLFCGGSGFLAAQDNADASGPPKVLVIQRESLKPGKTGSTHDKTESAFIRAMAASKGGSHYIGMDSLSGPSRSLFFTGYDSFADWEKDNTSIQKDATLTAALDRASLADGELLTSYETGVFVYREDFSMPGAVNIGQMRYMDITRFKVREGHGKEWRELGKIYKDAYKKSVPDANWAMFELMYGGENGVYLMITPMKSAGEIDHEMTTGAAMDKSMSESDKKKMSELAAACIESSQSNLFMFNPKMSYPTESMVKADPAFWKPKMLAVKETRSTRQDAKPAQ